MSSKKKEKIEENEVEDIDESYYSESGSDEADGSQEQGNQGYFEQDSNSDSGSDESDQDNLNAGMQKQREEAIALQQTWGTTKTNFYGRNKDNDDESDTSDDEDELEQAERLQAIKAQKMKRFM